jgi:chitodextrinase
VVRRSLIPALVLLSLALGAGDAQAAAYQITHEPVTPLAGDEVTFHAKRVNPGNGGKGDTFSWDFGDGATGTGRNPTHVYTKAGTYTVVLTVSEAAGTSVEKTTLVVASGANAPPSAAFSVAPASPFAGELVRFTGGSDPDGDSVTWSWDFGDGTTDTAAAPGHEYANPGNYIVTLTVTDVHGASAATFQTVTVRAPGGGSSPPGGGSSPIRGGPLAPLPGAPALVPMRPFPVVRIAGAVLARVTLVRILSVRGPRGMRVQVRCRGRGCPVGSISRTSAARVLRLHAFERRLPVRTTLEIFIRKASRIGKYTRFIIRAGKAPARIDRCLIPGRARPVRCR